MGVSSALFDRCYAKQEATYGTLATLTAANFVRHISLSVNNMPFGEFATSEERVEGQDPFEAFQRRSVTAVSLSAYLRGAPSGSTKPYLDPVLVNAFGAEPLVVNAASGLVSAENAGRIVGIAGATDKMLRPVKVSASGAPTPEIALSGAAIYKSVSYNFGPLLKSCTIRRQPKEFGEGNGVGPGTPGAPPQLAVGWVVDSFSFALDGTGEAMAQFSGPAQRAYEGVANVDAGGAGPTIAGAPNAPHVNPPQGMICKLWMKNLDAQTPTWVEVPHPFRSLGIEMTLPKGLRNDEAGTAYATGAYINGQRSGMFSLRTYAERNNAFWAAIQAGKVSGIAPHFAIFVTTGNVEGGRCAWYMPRVRLDLPSPSDEVEGESFDFSGTLLAESFDNTNSSLVYIAG